LETEREREREREGDETTAKKRETQKTKDEIAVYVNARSSSTVAFYDNIGYIRGDALAGRQLFQFQETRDSQI
jgi:hypothetical protein